MLARTTPGYARAVLDPIVIVGASLAGLRAAEALRQAGHDGAISIIGEEPHPPYDRPPLSKQVLTGRTSPEATALAMADGLDVEWLTSTAAVGLDLDARRVSLDGGGDIAYAGLVIATGAQPRVLPAAPPGPGIHYLRTLDDAVALRDDLARAASLVVVGAGFIGLEVAGSAQQMGVPTVVLEALPVPLERALGAEVGRSLMEWHRGKGTDIRAGVGVDAVVGGDRPEGVRTNDGKLLSADTVVIGIGVTPATGWLDGSGVDLADGVCCDSRLRVLRHGHPLADVVAAGDVARWAHPGYGVPVRIEHWTNATEAGEAAAVALLRGDEAPEYSPTPYFWSDQHGVKLQFVGRAGPDVETLIVEGSFDADRILVAYGRDGRLVGALGMRRPARVMAYQRLIAEGAAFPPEA
jgi:3-phenylpropionate/trans-cinnamate dioxygenase ferredoxin reductase subunit